MRSGNDCRQRDRRRHRARHRRLGWAALWAPAQRFAIDLIPHRFERRAYARLAQLEIRVEHEEHDVTTVKTDGASAAQQKTADP
jgi:hypothetical protein